MDTGHIPMDYEFTVAPDTPRRMSRAHVVMLWRGAARRNVALFATVTVVLLNATSDHRGWRSRLVAAGFWAAVLTIGFVALVMALSYRLTLRNVGRSASAGSVLRTGFGESEFVTENALSSSRFSYDAVESVRSAHGFVSVRYVGHAVPRIYPAELFPSEVIARLEKSTAAASPDRRIPWAWLIIGACVVAALLELRSGGGEAAFCDDLRRIDEPVAALRQAKADDEFDDVPALVAALRDAYQSVTPPPALRTDWATAIEYLDFLNRSALAVQQRGRPLDPSPQDDARFSAAMTSITDFAVEACDNRRRSLLVP